MCMNFIMEGLLRLLCINHRKTSPYCNLHLLSIMVQQCTYKNRLHHDGYGQVKNYNECIYNLSLLNEVDIFQYTNILQHKKIA